MPARGVQRNGWPLGINNVAAESALHNRELRDAVDVDLDDSGYVTKRAGRTQVVAGTGIHSLWSGDGLCLFVQDGALKRLWPGWEVTELGSGLTLNQRMSYCPVNGEVYHSNGVETGIVGLEGTLRFWGVPYPNKQPTLAISAVGSLEPGHYQVATTFVSSSGEEGGTGRSAAIELSAKGGISLTDIPQNTQVAYTRLYVSSTNSELPRFLIDLPTGVTTYLVQNASSATSAVKGEPLRTQFLRPMPAGCIVRHFKGRMYVAAGRFVHHSQPLLYGLHDPRSDYYAFSDTVTVMEPVTDGIYVVGDRTYFLSGPDAESARQVLVSPDQAISGTGMQVPVELFDAELVEGAEGFVAFWQTQRGPRLGLPGGKIKDLTKNRLAYPQYDSGHSAVREYRGIRQIITTMFGSGEQSKFAMGDQASVEVIRNGIVLPE